MTLSTSDDWFAEPVVPESRHDAYTRRLKAWGYLTRKGETAWDQPAASAFSDALAYYSKQMQKELNRSLSRTFYGVPPWYMDPERKEP